MPNNSPPHRDSAVEGGGFLLFPVFLTDCSRGCAIWSERICFVLTPHGRLRIRNHVTRWFLLPVRNPIQRTLTESRGRNWIQMSTPTARGVKCYHCDMSTPALPRDLFGEGYQKFSVPAGQIFFMSEVGIDHISTRANAVWRQYKFNTWKRSFLSYSFP